MRVQDKVVAGASETIGVPGEDYSYGLTVYCPLVQRRQVARVWIPHRIPGIGVRGFGDDGLPLFNSSWCHCQPAQAFTLDVEIRQ
jgi:hypothetical protein